ncbi:MAG: hypothetical protein NE327_06315 [Lentisphaeraceae bacterium]|nr:hypothetical protein [Lentisphaeraceae bacterium]
MIHTLILGASQYGKTTVAKSLAEELSKLGCFIVVYDKEYDKRYGQDLKEEWNADFITGNFEEFREFLWTHTNCVAFVEECNFLTDDDAPLTTYIRHLGHSMVFSGHKVIDFPTKIRGEINQVITSRGLKSHGKLIQEFIMSEELDNIQEIERYEFTWVNPLIQRVESRFNGRDQKIIAEIAETIADEAEAGYTERVVKRIGIYESADGSAIDFEYLKEEGYLFSEKRYGTEKI